MKTFELGQTVVHLNGHYNANVMSGSIESITVNGRDVDRYNYKDNDDNDIILHISNGKWCYPHQVCA